MLTIREIKSKDQIEELSHQILSSPKHYNQYFNPFSFRCEELMPIILNSEKDLYYIVMFENKIAGFFMLRGFDRKFDVPSYGVWVNHEFSKKGIAGLTLKFSISILKILSVKKIMLKVHPDNISAKKIYESYGFQFSHIDKNNDNLVYYKKIND